MIKEIRDLTIESEIDLGRNFKRLFLESTDDSNFNEVGIWQCTESTGFHCHSVMFAKGDIVMQVTFDGEFSWYKVELENETIKEFARKYFEEFTQKYKAKLEAEGYGD